MALPNVVCIIRPATDKPAPAMSAASRRGMRMLQMIRAAVPPLRPSSASKHSAAVMWEEPTSRQPSAASATAQISMTITVVFLCCRMALRSMCPYPPIV